MFFVFFNTPSSYFGQVTENPRNNGTITSRASAPEISSEKSPVADDKKMIADEMCSGPL